MNRITTYLSKGIHPNQYGFIKNVITNEYIGVKYANTQSRILREFMVPYNELLWELWCIKWVLAIKCQKLFIVAWVYLCFLYIGWRNHFSWTVFNLVTLGWPTSTIFYIITTHPFFNNTWNVLWHTVDKWVAITQCDDFVALAFVDGSYFMLHYDPKTYAKSNVCCGQLCEISTLILHFYSWHA